MKSESAVESLMNIRDRTIPFLSRQFNRFESCTKKEGKAIRLILDRLDQMESMFDLFVNSVDAHPSKCPLAMLERIVPGLSREQREKATKNRKPMSIRHFYGGRSAANVFFFLLEELILYSECRFVDPKSPVSLHHSAELKEAWHSGLGETQPSTMLLHLHPAIRNEICYHSENARPFIGF